MIADAAATLRRRWIDGGYWELARILEDTDILDALDELAPWETPSVSPTAKALTGMHSPIYGMACDIRGG